MGHLACSMCVWSIASLPLMTDRVWSANLTFMFITSFGQFGLNSSGVVPAAEMAIRDINDESGLLPGHTLTYDAVRDSQCQFDKSLEVFFQGIQSAPVKLAIIGCGCSVATEPVAAISHHWNISQVSYFSASIDLSSRSKYKRFFRANPSLILEPLAFLSMVKHFGWKRIALLTQNEAVYTMAAARLETVLTQEQYTSKVKLFQTALLTMAMDEDDFFLKNDDYRVFFLNSYPGPAREIICKAIKQQLTYPKYVWIMRDSFADNWWTETLDKGIVGCTNEEVEVFLDKVLLITIYPSPEDNTALTETGITAQQFQEEYDTRASQMNYEATDAAGRAYDAVWILAMALNRTMAMVKSGNINGTGCEKVPGSLVPLEQFQYSNEMMGCLIQYNIQITNFSGVSGRTQFDSNGTRIQNVGMLKQYRLSESGGVSKIELAVLGIQDGNSFMFLPGFSDSYVYNDGIPPDGRAMNKTVTYSVQLVVVSYCFAACGEVFALICLIFSIVLRNKRNVNLSSHNLNYLIIAGAMCMYASVIVYIAPTIAYVAVQVTCQLSKWMFIVGYTLCYGSVLGRMWRVLYIHQNPKVYKKFVQDWHMVMFTLTIAGIGVLIVSIETIISSLKGSVTRLENYEQLMGRTTYDVREFYYIWVCHGPSKAARYMRVLIFLYLAGLQIAGIILALQTRKVKHFGLEDAKYVAATIYVSSLMLMVIVLDAFVLDVYLNTSGILWAACVVTLTTAILLLIFVPKMILLCREKISENINSSPPQNSANSNGHSSSLVYLEEELAQKEKLVISLCSELDNLKKQLSAH